MIIRQYACISFQECLGVCYLALYTQLQWLHEKFRDLVGVFGKAFWTTSWHLLALEATWASQSATSIAEEGYWIHKGERDNGADHLV